MGFGLLVVVRLVCSLSQIIGCQAVSRIIFDVKRFYVLILVFCSKSMAVVHHVAVLHSLLITTCTC